MDIISQILDAARGGAMKTMIMYNASLSYPQLKGYLSVLTENALLEYEKGQHKYRTTEKGMKFLRFYEDIDKITGAKKMESGAEESSTELEYLFRKAL
jgi:predicted transcriptional regulator